MIGMGSVVTKNVLPFTISFGVPSQIQRINRLGLLRSGVNENDIHLFDDWFQKYIQDGSYNQLNHDYNHFIKNYLDLL